MLAQWVVAVLRLATAALHLAEEVLLLQAKAAPVLLPLLLRCLQCDLEVRLAVVLSSLNCLLRLGGTVLGLVFKFLRAACNYRR